MFIYLSGFHCEIIQESVDYNWVLHHFSDYKPKKKVIKLKKKNHIWTKKCNKKSILQTCGHRFGVEGLQLSKIWATERVKDKTSDWALASRAHFRGAYLFGLLAFVLFQRVQFTHVIFLLQGHWQFTNSFLFPGVQSKISNTKELNHGNVGKWKIKDTCFHFLKKVQHNTSQNEDLLCYFQNSGIEQCCLVFNFHCSVFMLISWII